MRPTPGANPPAAVERVLAGPHAQHRMAYLAGKLIENGYPLVPVRWGRKGPLLDDWTRDWERPPTIEEVNGWLAHWPDCGVGIPCGRVIATDIDIVDSVKHALAMQQLAYEVLGYTPCLRIGLEPKRLLVYRTEEPFRTMSEGKLQILGQGAQFVAYNWHQEAGRLYDWVGGEGLVENPFEQLPVITHAQAREYLDRAWKILPSRYRGSRTQAERKVREIADHGQRRGTMRALGEALNFIDNSGDGVDYQAWINVGLALDHSLGIDGLPLFEGWSQQSSKYNCKGVNTERIYLTLNSRGERTAGSIYQEAQANGWDPEADVIFDGAIEAAVEAVTLGEGLFERTQPNGDGAHVPDPEPDTTPEPEIAHELPALEPNHALVAHPGGILEEFANWITNTIDCPQPELAMGAAITLVGFLGAHRYRLRHGGHDTRTNVIVVGLAPSGAGKDHPRQCIKAVLDGLQMTKFYSEDIASGQGLEGAFLNQFANLVLMDEYGHRVASALHRSGNPNEKKLIEVITKLATSAAGKFKHTRRAENRNLSVPFTCDPCLVMFNTTVEEPLWKGLSSGSINDGSLARHLFIRTSNPDPDPPDGILPMTELLPEMIEHGRRILCGGPPDPLRLVNALGKLEALYIEKVRRDPRPPVMIDVPFTPEAEVELARVKRDQLRLMRNAKLDRSRAMISRLSEHTKTLAEIAAISQDPGQPMMTARHVLWGEAVVRQSIEIALTATAKHVAETEHHADSNRLWRDIERVSHGNWIKTKAVTYVTRWCDKRKRQGLLDDLVEADLLDRRQVKTPAGRVAIEVRSKLPV